MTGEQISILRYGMPYDWDHLSSVHTTRVHGRCWSPVYPSRPVETGSVYQALLTSSVKGSRLLTEPATWSPWVICCVRYRHGRWPIAWQMGSAALMSVGKLHLSPLRETAGSCVCLSAR